jgi:hypothetical protein
MILDLPRFRLTGAFTPVYDPWVDPVLRVRLLDYRRRYIGRDRFYDREHYCLYVTWWLFGRPIYQRVEGQSRFDPDDWGEKKPARLKLFVSNKELYGSPD